jgi:protein TonB
MLRAILILALLSIAGCTTKEPSVRVAAAVSAPSTTVAAVAAKAGSTTTNESGTKPADAPSDPVRNWQMSVINRLQPFMKWPNDAPIHVESASPLVQVTIDRKGRVLNARVVKSCGFSAFDIAARWIFKRAATLPAPPPELAGDPLSFTIAVTFTQKHSNAQED